MKTKIKKILLFVLILLLGLFALEIVVVKYRLGKPTQTELKKQAKPTP